MKPASLRAERSLHAHASGVATSKHVQRDPLSDTESPRTTKSQVIQNPSLSIRVPKVSYSSRVVLPCSSLRVVSFFPLIFCVWRHSGLAFAPLRDAQRRFGRQVMSCPFYVAGAIVTESPP
ncbi:hypothetical protein BaRGS_00004880 [Batillaria attramentaria]|uniref:Uncharacterized protein n=1 Tax=Batillaria attramentaria TaxID=370345 RepID=A0ABD0LXS8_9CAEN